MDKSKWLCEKCKMYKKINYNNIKVGEKVFFYKLESIDNKVVLVLGGVLSRRGIELKVLTSTGIVTLNDFEVNPIKSPAALVYNMFGVCRCY